MNIHIEKIKEFQKEQNNKCYICEREIEKPYLDADYQAGLAFAVTCLDCYSIMSSCDYDEKHLKKIIKFLKLRDKIYAMNDDSPIPS